MVTLIVNPEANEARTLDCANRLRGELHALEKHRVHMTIRVIGYWYLYASHVSTLPHPPAYLLDDLIAYAQFRREPCLSAVLNTLASIVELAPDSIDDDKMQALCRTLEYIQDSQEPAQDMESRHRYLTCRQNAEHLAANMVSLLKKRGKPLPSVLKKWRDEGVASPLREFRRLWQAVSAESAQAQSHSVTWASCRSTVHSGT